MVHSRSGAQKAPHSVTTNRRPGCLSNVPAQMRNHRGRDDHQRTSVVYMPTCGPYAALSAEPECTCTGMPISAQAAHTGSYRWSWYGGGGGPPPRGGGGPPPPPPPAPGVSAPPPRPAENAGDAPPPPPP